MAILLLTDVYKKVHIFKRYKSLSNTKKIKSQNHFFKYTTQVSSFFGDD